MDLLSQESSLKPKAVWKAEVALWIWTIWTCFLGVYQSWKQIPEIETAIADQLQGVFMVTPATLFLIIAGAYLILAVTSAWVILKLGAGKSWARTSLIAGFVLDAGWTALPPYEGWAAHLEDIPDFGFQLYALFMVYTNPGSMWFKPKLSSRV